MSDIKKYTDKFATLRTAKMLGMPAPHKAVLLLTVIDLIEYSAITSHKIELSERLEQQFKRNWDRYVGRSVVFNPVIGTPFFHLHSEPFWKLIPFQGGEETILKLRKGNPCAVKTMRKHFCCAEIDKELFELMRNDSVRAELRTTLISNYVKPQKRLIDKIVPALLFLVMAS